MAGRPCYAPAATIQLRIRPPGSLAASIVWTASGHVKARVSSSQRPRSSGRHETRGSHRAVLAVARRLFGQRLREVSALRVELAARALVDHDVRFLHVGPFDLLLPPGLRPLEGEVDDLS